MQEGRGKHWISIIALLCCVLHLSGQEVQVRGGFIEDSLLIGEDVNYWIVAEYPPDLELVFPDSSYSYAPFEFSSKTYFPTQVINGLAYDSTIYHIQSYEIDKVQYLALPAILFENGDSTILTTPTDSIFLTELAPVVTDTTKLKTNLAYQTVAREFNYPLLYYILGALAILLILTLLIFGKRIRRWFVLRRLRKQYEVFDASFHELVKKLKVDPDPDLAERALVLWKKFQEKLEKKPFSVLTTKEILTYDFASELEKPLQSIDRVVYGKHVNEHIFQDFLQIEDFVQHRYSKKVAEIKDGK